VTYKTIRRDRVKPGDLALHKDNQLDAREVARVDGDSIWIWIGRDPFGPYPRENYTYSRRTSS
jgi:hypothetical protein